MNRLTVITLMAVLMLATPTASAQLVERGQIADIQHRPDQPTVFESVELTITAVNPSQNIENYLLEVSILHEGVIAYQTEFTFSLSPRGRIVLSPIFIPSKDGIHDIVAKLYSKDRATLFDTQISDFFALSEIGPFDIFVSIPAKLVVVGTKMPVQVNIENNGRKGVDLNVAVALECFKVPDIKQNFFVFAGNQSQLSRVIEMTTCAEEGLHEVTAQVLFFDRAVATAKSQVFLNKTLDDIIIVLPFSVAIPPGQSKRFDVVISNPSKVDTLRDVKIVVEGVPTDWVSVRPGNVFEIKPEDTYIYLVEISVPLQHQVGRRELGIFVVGDNIARRKAINLVIGKEENVPIPPESAPITQEGLDILDILVRFQGFILLAAIIVISVIALRRKRKKRRFVLKV